MDPQDFQDIRPGVLNQNQVSKLKDKLVYGLDDKEIDLSAFDLHLSQEGWEMPASMKPLRQEDISKITKEHGKHLQGDGPWELNREKTYIFQLREDLKLQKGHMFQGQATGKSSIGRLDVLSRLMVNKCAAFDTIDDDGYGGSLYLEVTPITFPIKVKEGLALAQLRLFRGKPEWTELKPDEGLQLYNSMILDENGQPKTANISDLTVNLLPDENNFIAFRTKDKVEIKDKKLVVDLTQGEKSNDPKLFWEPELANKNSELEIIPERFYILRSKERFKLPPDVAVYCKAVSETLGELRIHYAGFVHPGFGRERDKGTPIIFEVRGHNVNVRLRDGETLARVKFYRMSEQCSQECLDSKRTVYGDQELKLSKYFWDRTK